MQEFRDKRMMGHAFQRCGFKIKVKWYSLYILFSFFGNIASTFVE